MDYPTVAKLLHPHLGSPLHPIVMQEPHVSLDHPHSSSCIEMATFLGLFYGSDSPSLIITSLVAPLPFLVLIQLSFTMPYHLL